MGRGRQGPRRGGKGSRKPEGTEDRWGRHLQEENDIPLDVEAALRAGAAERAGVGKRAEGAEGAGRKARVLGSQPSDDSAYALPEAFVSARMESSFASYGVRVWEDAPACQGVRPGPSLHPSPIIAGRNYSYKEVVKGSRGEIPMRAVVWSARSGLGNAIRGLVATFVYALLSGRQVLLSTGGPYGATFETVALGFEYKMDQTERAVPRVPLISFQKNPAVWDSLPVVQANPSGSYESFWFEDVARRRCVMEALRCEDLWCVHSKILTIAIGAPSPLLGQAIEAAVRFELPDQQPLPGKEGQLETPKKEVDGSGTERQLAEREVTEKRLAERQLAERQLAERQQAERQLAEQQERRLGEEKVEERGPGPTDGGLESTEGASIDALKLKFDVAVHVRSAHKCVEQAQDAATCSDRGLPGVAEALDVFPGLHNAVSVQRWACFSHFLAFLLRLKIQRHTQAQAQARAQGGVQGGGEEGDKVPPGGGREALLHSEEDRAALREFLSERHRKAQGHPNATSPSGSVPPALSGKLSSLALWRVEDAEAMAQEARLEAAAGYTEGTPQGTPGGSSGGVVGGGVPGESGAGGSELGVGLAILLVTDSQALRPLFVEFLRPFGTVAYSAARVVHLVHRVGDAGTRLGNLAEFYLMSRASAIISYRSLRSTYARVAALYGNATLIYGLEKATCSYPLEHMGMPV